jgi:hypothetical protein
VPRDDALGGNSDLVHAKKGGAMLNEQVELMKAARVKEQLEPFPTGQLPRLVLLLHALHTTQSSLLLFSLRQLLQPFGNCAHMDFSLRIGLSWQRVILN